MKDLELWWNGAHGNCDGDLLLAERVPRKLAPHEIPPLELVDPALRAGLAAPARARYRYLAVAVGQMRGWMIHETLSIPELAARTGLTRKQVAICLQYLRRRRELQPVGWRTTLAVSPRPSRTYRVVPRPPRRDTRGGPALEGAER